MKTTWQLALSALFCFSTMAAGADDEEQAPPETPKGKVLTFTNRSPLTTAKELALRLSQKALDADYDLGKEKFLTYVPDSYDPNKPLGLIVLLNYKGTGVLPDVVPVFKERNIAFIAPQNDGQPWPTKCGLAVDAVHNMQMLYKVDPGRIYIFGYDRDCCATRVGCGFPDVFCGMVVTGQLEFWKNIPTEKGRYMPAKLPIPPVRYLPVAKTHPLVLCVANDSPIFGKVPKAFTAEGFREVKRIDITTEDYHYPHYDKKWLVEALDFLDKNAAQRRPKSTAVAPRPPTTSSTTRRVAPRPAFFPPIPAKK